MTCKSLLLIDLDGVLVTDGTGDTRIDREILKIHQDLGKEIDGFGHPVAVLTHRSRHEALQVTAVLGLDTKELAGVFSANEIVFSDLSIKGLVSLLRRGSRKSRILPYITRHLNISPENIVFIDDRRKNVDDMASQGVGLAIKVPSARLQDDNRLLTFDLSGTLERIRLWFKEENKERGKALVIEVDPVVLETTSHLSSGIKLRRLQGDIYGRIRGTLKSIRHLGGAT